MFGLQNGLTYNRDVAVKRQKINASLSMEKLTVIQRKFKCPLEKLNAPFASKKQLTADTGL